ncbi:MAG: YdcF family protein [Verrucomicrobia bacterium]|nr:YdcF family protein [Verrucomicrobiota bacterium]
MFILASPFGGAFFPAMLFALKKFVAFWLLPLPACLTLLVAGLVLTYSARRARLGRALLITATGLLLLFSNKLVSVWLIRPLEARYPVVPELREGTPLPAALAACRYVVVLGGGHGDTPWMPATLKLSASSLGRITEAARLLRQLPEATLLLSGPPAGHQPGHATVFAQAAQTVGIARDRIRYIDNARDTEDESNAVKRLVGDAPVALVTSAWHMPRSAALFRHAGVNALPCPADFKAKPSPGFRWSDCVWDTESLDRSTAAVRERIGYLWIWLRGKT